MIMKTVRRFLFMVTGLLLTATLFNSCLDDDDNNNVRYPNALVTAKTAADQTFYLQLDENTTLLPVNIKKSPYGDKEVRALVNYSKAEGNPSPYSQCVQLNWIDSILTKPTVPNLFADNDKVYGNDPVEIINDWVTIAEDGYLTLRFRTYWGRTLRPHSVNLLIDPKGDKPYEIEFRHNANGDFRERIGDALVAFNLKDLPDTEGKTVKLKLKWRAFNGTKTAEFNYKTGEPIKGKLIQGSEHNFKNLML